MSVYDTYYYFGIGNNNMLGLQSDYEFEFFYEIRETLICGYKLLVVMILLHL